MKASPTSLSESEFVHRGKGPDDILLTVAGGLAGGHSTLVTSWSRGRASIMQTRPIGVPPRSWPDRVPVPSVRSTRRVQ
jgi:hypothetical protein